MRTAVVGLIVLSGMVWAAPDLNESYNSLKAAVDKKDVAQVKALAAQTAKEAKEVATETQPADPSAVDAWKGRQKFAKDAETYSEYALSVSAIQASDPAVTIDLVNTLIAQNPKSQYLDECASSYLTALSKQGSAQVITGANKILAGDPDNEDALYALASNSLSSSPSTALTAANKLVAAMRSKPKPENVSEADWNKRKDAMMGAGYYFSGVIEASQRKWVNADRSLKAALPLISGQPAMLGPAYFYLGVANYQLGKLTSDRSRMQAGIQYTEKAAGIAGPMQSQAANNVAAMKREAGVR
jgi:hypothetical protein